MCAERSTFSVHFLIEKLFSYLKFISLTNTFWGCVLKTVIRCDVFRVSKQMEVVRDTSVATIKKHESSNLKGVLTHDIYATDVSGSLSVAVITGDPAGKASIVYSCTQRRLKCQYN